MSDQVEFAPLESSATGEAAGSADLDGQLDHDVVQALEVAGAGGLAVGAGLERCEFDLIGHGRSPVGYCTATSVSRTSWALTSV